MSLAAFASGCGDSPTSGGGDNPSIKVGVASNSVNISAGGTASSTVSVQRLGGFDGPISLSVSGNPATVSAAISPSTVPAGSSSASITWTAVASAASGSHTVTVSASGSGVTAATTTLELVVVQSNAVATVIERVEGDNQTVASGEAVPIKPRVRVRDQRGDPVSGVTVTFAVDTGSGVLVDSVVTSGVDGTATPGSWSPGPGRNILRVTAGTLAPVRFATTGVGEMTLVTMPIPTGGGTLVVTRPGSPLNGFTITVPNGSFATPNNVSVSHGTDNTGAPSKPGLRIVSPVISVTSSVGGFTTSQPLELRIPATFKKSEWPVVLMFDRNTGKYEVLMSSPVDTTAVVAVTRHLDASFIDPDPTASAVAFKKGGSALAQDFRGLPSFSMSSNQMIDPSVQLVIGAVDYADLVGTLDTDYRSEADDWEFDPAIIYDDDDRFFNALPLASAWYFQHYKGQRGALANRFREAEGVVLSNAQGLRLGPALTSQVNLDAVLSMYSALIKLPAQTGITPDSLSLLNIKANIFTTGRPQVILGTGDTDASRPTMLLVYRTRGSVMDVTLGTSAPGISAPRSISLIGGSGFGATTWGAKDVGTDQYISYVATGYVPTGQTAGMNAKSLNAAWQTVFAGTAGDNTLPQYHIASTDIRKHEDTIWIPGDSTRIWFECPECSMGLQPGPDVTPTGKMAGGIMVTREGTFWNRAGAEQVAENGLLLDTLDDGKHVGFVVYNLVEGTDLVSYLDWGEYTIKRRTVKVTPDTSTVYVGEKFTLNAELEDRPLPPGASWTWEMGDGRTLTGRTSEIEESFESLLNDRDTTFNVVARLYSNGELYASGRAKVSVKAAAPHWAITTFFDAEGLFDDEDEISTSGDLALLFKRLVAAPRSGLISIVELEGGATELRLRVKKGGLWEEEMCCPPPPFSGGAEYMTSLGRDPAVPFNVGPYFSAFNATKWSQTSTNLNEGSVTGMFIPGLTVYQIKDLGSQTGPAGAIRITGTRDGKNFTGVIIITIWFEEADSGEIEAGADHYEFPFTAIRMR